jgi:hypothetical protein
MKGSAKYLAALVAVLVVSSAVFASPNGNSRNCASASTEGAIWSSSLENTQATTGNCPTVAMNGTQRIQQDSASSHVTDRIVGSARSFLGNMKSLIEGAIWNFVPPPPK